MKSRGGARGCAPRDSPLSAKGHLAVPRGPLIFMSQRGRTTVCAIEGFFVGFFRSAPRINPPATGDENRLSQ